MKYFIDPAFKFIALRGLVYLGQCKGLFPCLTVTGLFPRTLEQLVEVFLESLSSMEGSERCLSLQGLAFLGNAGAGMQMI